MFNPPYEQFSVSNMKLYMFDSCNMSALKVAQRLETFLILQKCVFGKFRFRNIFYCWDQILSKNSSVWFQNHLMGSKWFWNGCKVTNPRWDVFQLSYHYKNHCTTYSFAISKWNNNYYSRTIFNLFIKNQHGDRVTQA